MSNYSPVFHSPIVQTSESTASLRLQDLSGSQITLIQGDVGDLLAGYFSRIPTTPGDLVDINDGLMARLTPTEFYLFAKLPTDLPAPAALDDTFAQANRFAHATDISHGKAALRLVGHQAAELLSKVCGLDFHDTVFPNMSVAQSSAAKIKTLIARYDEAETPAYYLHVNRPFGQYFWDILWDAGQEFGIEG